MVKRTESDQAFTIHLIKQKKKKKKNQTTLIEYQSLSRNNVFSGREKVEQI